MRNKRLFFAVLGLSIGSIFGAIQYWDDIRPGRPDTPQNMTWQSGDVNQQVMENTANIEQLLALMPPRIDADAMEWKSFLSKLDQVDTGKRYSNSGTTSPLLAWYAYIAKHHPSTLYQALGSREFNTSKFNHLLGMGFLGDWYVHVDNADELILGSPDALISLALSEGRSVAQQKVIDAFFNISNNSSRVKKVNLNLENLRFAFDAMSPDQKQDMLGNILTGSFSIDPRDVRRLALIKNLDRAQLLAVVKKFAYPSKSMSSYMTTGALLGEPEYVLAMAGDILDNAKQPSNFYCSICGLSLSTEGLLGRPLIAAYERGRLNIAPSGDHGFVLSEGESNRKIMEWADE